MAILQQCPICRNKQKLSNKHCKCGQDLYKAKQSNRVKYWANYRLPNGKQRCEYVGKTIKEARASEGKRLAQKQEAPRVLNLLAVGKTTFSDLSKWYIGLGSIKKLATYPRIKCILNHFNSVFGETCVNDITLTDLENYQIKRKRDRKAPATIDLEIAIIRAMIIKAFDNDMIAGEALRPFRRIKKSLKGGSNARHRILTFDEYLKLIESAQDYLKPIIIVGMNTGMRLGEILNLRWSNFDRKAGVLKLSEAETKEARKKIIPLNHHVQKVISRIVPHLYRDEDKDNYVFTCHNKPLKSVTRNFENACNYSGLPYGRKQENGITFHDIRRTVKTNMLKAGIDKVYRDIILGHSLTGMDAYYMAPTIDDLKNVMNKYTNWLDCQLELQNVDQTVDHATGN